MKYIFRMFRVPEWRFAMLTLLFTTLFVLYQKTFEMRLYVIFLFYLSCSYSYGFILNSYADRKEDYASGRNVYIFKFKKRTIITILILLGLLMVVIPFFMNSIWAIVIGFVNFILATAYSVRPIRLKEGGFFGFFLLVLVMTPLPFLLFSFAFDITLIETLVFLGFLILVSFAEEISHQHIDYTSDKKSGTKTWATFIGTRRVRQYYGICLILAAFYPVLFFALYPVWHAIVISLFAEILLLDHYDEYIEVKRLK